MLPKFPEFKKLELSDQKTIEAIAFKLPPYSDYIFANLIAWDEKGEVEISELNGNLLVITKDWVAHDIVCTFLGCNDVNGTLDKIFKYLETTRKDVVGISLVPEVCIKEIDSTKFKVILDSSNSDYVYDLKELVQFKGAKYASKRNLLNLFKSNHKGIDFKMMDLSSDEYIKQILALNKKWMQNKDTQEMEYFLNLEQAALNKVLVSKLPNLVGLGLFNKGELLSYNILVIGANKYAVGLFMKYDSTHRGLNEYMINKSAEYLVAQGCEYLNAGEDLGLAGLRFSKNSFRPVFFLNKYSVYRN